jgi:hypothetical protein
MEVRVDRKKAWRWTGIVVAVLMALAGAIGGGAYVGAELTARFHDSLHRQIERGELDDLHWQVRLLDTGDLKRLRERLTAAQDSQLLTVCLRANDKSGSGKAFVADEWAVLRRVAEYRRDHPPTYPEAVAKRKDDSIRILNERINACLKAALEHVPDKAEAPCPVEPKAGP